MNKPFVLFASTRYESTNDVRFRCAERSIKNANSFGIPFIILDGSVNPSIAESFRRLGAVVYLQQTKGMGPGRRELSFYTVEYCREHGVEAAVYTEPEKDGFIRFAEMTAQPIFDGASISLSLRTERSRQSYPKFQQKTELQMLPRYAKALGIPEAKSFLGPQGFSLPALIRFVIGVDPKRIGIEDTYVHMYAAIIARRLGWPVCLTEEFDFVFPKDQLQEEEAALNEVIREKRLWQLKSLSSAFKKLSESQKILKTMRGV